MRNKRGKIKHVLGLVLLILLIVVCALVILWLFSGGDVSFFRDIFSENSVPQPPALPD